jgi:hypothetical protein
MPAPGPLRRFTPVEWVLSLVGVAPGELCAVSDVLPSDRRIVVSLATCGVAEFLASLGYRCASATACTAPKYVLRFLA